MRLNVEAFVSKERVNMPYQSLYDHYGAARKNAAMPVLKFLAIAGSALIALLFVADATLEKNGSPVIATSQRSGLPEPPQPRHEIDILTSTPAPAPDMTSQAVLDAQPKPAQPKPAFEPLEKLRSEARAARAEAPPERNRITRPTEHERNRWIDRFSIKDQ